MFKAGLGTGVLHILPPDEP